MAYGQWVKPDRFTNFTELLPVYLNQLKVLAYRVGDDLNGEVRRYVNKDTGSYGYIIELPGEVVGVNKLVDYFKTNKLLAVSTSTVSITVDDVNGKGTIGANLQPGSVAIYDTVKDGSIIAVDDGLGGLTLPDRVVKLGTINYKTGEVVFNQGVIESTSDVTVTCAKVGTFAEITEGVGTESAIKNALIPNSNTIHTVTVELDSFVNKAYVGITPSGNQKPATTE